MSRVLLEFFDSLTNKDPPISGEQWSVESIIEMHTSQNKTLAENLRMNSLQKQKKC